MGISNHPSNAHIVFLDSLNYSYVKKATSPNETTQIRMCICHSIYSCRSIFVSLYALSFHNINCNAFYRPNY